MSAEAFRLHGHDLVDWIADYLDGVEDRPVTAQVEPGWVRRQLPPEPPERGEPFADVLADVERIVVPGLAHWQHPSWFAYFPANSSGPAVLGELLSAGLGVQGMLWATSPACTELEAHLLDWMVTALGLPEVFRSDGPGGGTIADSASSAVLCALLAARERATAGAINCTGIDRPLAVYATAQAHSSIEKAVRIAGLGSDALRTVSVDGEHALSPAALDAALEADRAAGVEPVMVVATVGTTSSSALDPLPEIAEVCRRHRVWLHVDAAYAGVAAVCPELRWIHAGLELADSYCTNAHKWLLTNFDCTLFYVADRAALVGALGILPEYLRNAATASGDVIDYRDWQVPLGRRFRALKLWFVLRHYGLEGLRAHIREHVEAASWLAQQVVAHPDFTLAAPAPLSLVCFRRLGGDALNERLLAALNDSGELYCTHTRLDGAYTLRLAVGGTRTERRHVEAAWARVTATAARLVAHPGAQRDAEQPV
ncbi:MAG: aspartate aminotransferase family protein [Euzebyales bacterium]|nr:aspartate aminotransferase family protein [Euzebyales bacterium]